LPVRLSVRTWSGLHPAQGIRRGRVALFLGCIARHTDSETIDAAIRLLTRIGFDVIVPHDQTCCGALHREAGEPETAADLTRRNRLAFAQPATDAILTLASGCGASLAEHLAGPTTPPVRDIHEFLDQAGLPAELEFATLDRRVAVQDPCSLRNGLRSEQSVYRLLAQIPGLHIEPLAGNAFCCGGAGGYPLREPELAERLREPKLASLSERKPDVLVSANLGCILHLDTGLRARHLDIAVLHPILLLEQQLRSREGSDALVRPARSPIR